MNAQYTLDFRVEQLSELIGVLRRAVVQLGQAEDVAAERCSDDLAYLPGFGSAIPGGRHSGVRPSGGRHSWVPRFRGPPVVIQGHRATWMTKSMLLNYAMDYQKSEALI